MYSDIRVNVDGRMCTEFSTSKLNIVDMETATGNVSRDSI